MGITIDDPETLRVLGELAALTGEDEEAALGTAIRERITRLRSERASRLERINAIVAEVAPLLKGLPDHDEYLYDAETGLPR